MASIDHLHGIFQVICGVWGMFLADVGIADLCDRDLSNRKLRGRYGAEQHREMH